MPTNDRVSARAYPALREQIPLKALITIENEYVVRGELPEGMGLGRVLRITALPSFLKTYVDRLTFSFTDYLRSEMARRRRENAHGERARAELRLARVQPGHRRRQLLHFQERIAGAAKGRNGRVDGLE